MGYIDAFIVGRRKGYIYEHLGTHKNHSCSTENIPKITLTELSNSAVNSHPIQPIFKFLITKCLIAKFLK